MASIDRRSNGKWRARYRLHSGGPQRARHLDRKTEAQRFLARVQSQLLRRFYASLLIAHGESVKVVQARLDHASTAETLDTYAHLWPENEERTRAAVDDVLGDRRSSGRQSI
jgi:integrase